MRKKKNKLNKILNDRGEQYGQFKKSAELQYKMKNCIQNTIFNLCGNKSEIIAMEYIFGKIARIVNGSLTKNKDSWQDIAGYAMLIVEEIDAKENKEKILNIGHKDEKETL